MGIGSLYLVADARPLDFLRRGTSSLPIKQAAQVQRTGWYPTRWQIRQDRRQDRVEVRLSQLVHREGTSKSGLASHDGR